MSQPTNAARHSRCAKCGQTLDGGSMLLTSDRKLYHIHCSPYAALSASQEAAALSEEPVAFVDAKGNLLIPDGSPLPEMLGLLGDDPFGEVQPLFASPAVAPVADAKQKIIEFAQAILHGDDEHRGWLMGAALAFNAGDELPAPRGKGTAPVAPVAVSVKGLPLWQVGSWGDGSTPAGQANIFCEAYEATVAAGILKEHAVAIVDAHNEALAALSAQDTDGVAKP